MKAKKSIAESLSQKEANRILEERRRKKREYNSRWRKKHPEENRAVYMRYYKKKRGKALVYKNGVGWVKKAGGN